MNLRTITKRLFNTIFSLLVLTVLQHSFDCRCEAAEISQLSMTDPFESLMGSELDNWHYLRNGSDRFFIEFYKGVYERNKDAQYSDHTTVKIPKVLHLIWLGPLDFPAESVKNIETWIEQNPSWTFVFWTDRERPTPCPGMQTRYVSDFKFDFLRKEFEASSNWGEKSDILRYEILYQEGGVYTDHDANCMRSFDGLNGGYDFYACLELPHRLFKERTVTVGIGIIGSKPKHHVLRQAINNVHENWGNISKRFSSSDKMLVLNRTYIAMTYACETHLNLPGNTDIVFPACYFYARHGLPAFYSTHYYGSAWFNKDDESTPKKQKKDKKWSLKKLFQ